MISFSFFLAQRRLQVCIFFLLLLLGSIFVSGADVVVFDCSKISTPDGDAATDALTTTPYSQGIRAFYDNMPTTFGVSISLVDISSFGSDVESALTVALKQKGTPTAVIGVYGDSNIDGALSALQDTNVTIFGGLVGGVPESPWNPQVIAAKMSPDGEMLLMLKYALVDLHVTRVGFMYTTGVSVGEKLYRLALYYLEKINAVGKLVVYAQPYANAFNSGNFSSFVSDSPTLTIIQSKPGAHMEAFVTAWMTDSRTKTGDLLGGTFQQMQLLSLYQTNKATFKGSVYIASSVPPKTGSGLNAMDTMLQNVPDATDANANIVFYGYTAMYALSYAIQSYSTTTDLYNNILVNFTRFLYDDYVMGFYGGPYSYVLSTQGAVSVCNQGGQSVWLMNYAANLSATLTDTHTNFQPTCGIQGYLPSATRLMCLSYDDPVLSRVFSEGCTSLQSDPVPDLALGAIKAITGETTKYHRIIIDTTDVGSLDAYAKQYAVEVVMGPLDPSTILPDNAIVWNPIYSTPRINMFQDNEYYFTPTLAQDMIMLYAFLTSGSSPPVSDVTTITVVMRADGDQAAYIQEAAVSLGALFGMTVYSENLGNGGSVSSAMHSSGYNMLIGINSNDVASVQSFLSSNKNAAAFLPYRTMSLIYPTAKTTFTSDVLSRVLTDSNIPYWENTSYTPIQKEMQLGLDIFRMNAYQFLGGSSSPTYTVPLVPSGIMVADGVTLGPYYTAGWVDPATGKIAARKRNWGAASTYLVDGDTWLNSNFSNTSFTFDPDASLFSYTSSSDPEDAPLPNPPELPNRDATVVEIVFLVLLGLAALSLLVVLLFLCVTRVYFPDFLAGNAPTNRKRPITVISTAIDFSNALWMEFPELQAAAAAEHDQIIRELIIKYKCYEVSSDGNRFVIAGSIPYHAVQLAAELQVAMVQHDWRTEKFDEWFRMLERMGDPESTSAIMPEVSTEEYKALWRGLRVRVAVHSGVANIYYQKSVMKYRYFGRTVETAQHVKDLAIGGQVLVTAATWDLLTPDEIASIDHTFLGSPPVIGEEEPVGVYQVNAVPGRVFGPLRRPTEFRWDESHGREISYGPNGEVIRTKIK